MLGASQFLPQSRLKCGTAAGFSLHVGRHTLLCLFSPVYLVNASVSVPLIVSVFLAMFGDTGKQWLIFYRNDTAPELPEFTLIITVDIVHTFLIIPNPTWSSKGVLKSYQICKKKVIGIQNVRLRIGHPMRKINVFKNNPRVGKS